MLWECAVYDPVMVKEVTGDTMAAAAAASQGQITAASVITAASTLQAAGVQVGSSDGHLQDRLRAAGGA